jgi:hypothetical protein
MSSLESEGTPEALRGDAVAAAEPAARREEAISHISRVRKLAILGAFLAGLAAFGIGEAVYKRFPIEWVELHERGPHLGPTQATVVAAATKNASLAFGALGLCLGGFLGAAGGLGRRSTRAATTGGLLGIVLGAALGAGVSLALLPFLLQAQYDYRERELLIALVMHTLTWGLLGASAGLAFAVGLGELRYIGRAVTGGLVGAALGAVAFELTGAALFTSANTHYAISDTWLTRFLACMLVALGTAAALVLLLSEPRKAGPKPN